LHAYKIRSQASNISKNTNPKFFITKVKFNKKYKNKFRILIFKVDVLHRGQKHERVERVKRLMRKKI
jgi:hypothetical protein